MLRRLLVAAAIIASISGLAPALQPQQVASASPNYEILNVQFAYTVTPGAEIVFKAESDYFDRDTNIIWAVVDFRDLAPGTKLKYILRLNGGDYTFGDFACCKDLTQGRLAYPLYRRDDPGRDIPGGDYTLLIFDGDKLIGQGSFGVRGGRGSDNEDPEPTGSTSSGGRTDQERGIDPSVPSTPGTPGTPGTSPAPGTPGG